MAINANSYGSTAGVAILAKQYTNGSNDFDSGTKPTITMVEGWIDEVSAIINVVMTNNGLSVPVTDANKALMLDFFVQSEVAALVYAHHGQGRFGPTAKNPSGTRYGLIHRDAVAFVDTMVTKNDLGDMAVSTSVSRTDGWD